MQYSDYDDEMIHSEILENLDPYTLLVDFLKNLWVILLAGAAAFFLVKMIPFLVYEPEYTVATTQMVTGNARSGSSFSTYSANAGNMCRILSDQYILKEVLEEIDASDASVQVSAEVIADSNLISLSVTAKKPTTAFRVCQGILTHYTDISELMYPGYYLYTLRAPAYPSTPSNSLNLDGLMKKAVLFTCLCMTLVILLCSYLYDSVKNERDVKNKLECSLFGCIYHEKKFKSLRMLLHAKEWRKKAILINSPLAGFGFVETCKRMREKFISRCAKSGKNCLVITSMFENEGKSTVAANLAIGLAGVGGKVVLVDADLRKPAVHKVFEVNEDCVKGSLADCLKGEKKLSDCLYKDPDSGLYLICSFHPSRSSSELVSSSGMEQLVKELKEFADYVIIDSPPLEMVGDAEALSAFTDYSLLVIRPDNAPTRAVNDCVDKLFDCHATLLGCVINNVSTIGLRMEQGLGFNVARILTGRKNKDYGYGCGYGYGSSYGYGEGKKKKKKSGDYRVTDSAEGFFTEKAGKERGELIDGE